MKLAVSVIFSLLVLGSAGLHLYFVIKKGEFKTFGIQMGFLLTAIFLGVLTIYNFQFPSIAEVFNQFAPPIDPHQTTGGNSS
jgi:hypothetical protein